MAICDNVSVLGTLLGISSAFFFAVNSIITRRGVLRVSSNYIAVGSIFTGTFFFLLLLALTGNLFSFAQIPWKALLFWILSGIIHFALGRTWAYRSIQFIGSNRSNVVTSLNPMVTIVLALLILHEEVNELMSLGILFSLAGPLVMLLKEKTLTGPNSLSGGIQGKDVNRFTVYKGFFYGAGAAVFWGSSAIFIKLAMKEGGGSPIAGSFLAYLAASVVVAPSIIMNPKNRREFFSEKTDSMMLAITCGLTSGLAQLLRYVALGYTSAIIVSLLNRTVPIWVLILSFMFMRRYESFSRWVLIGNGLLVIGTLLVVIS
ncbi:MAG: DMT family transporter [Deltaproteobacteria bacterium]|nr:DMT family transporter [Deltaproteobacteria bacterium]